MKIEKPIDFYYPAIKRPGDENSYYNIEESILYTIRNDGFAVWHVDRPPKEYFNSMLPHQWMGLPSEKRPFAPAPVGWKEPDSVLTYKYQVCI